MLKGKRSPEKNRRAHLRNLARKAANMEREIIRIQAKGKPLSEPEINTLRIWESQPK